MMSEVAVRSEVERAVFGDGDLASIDRWLAEVVEQRLGTSVERVVFRSGRIDAVYAFELADARQVALKVHRPPVDVPSLALTVAALRHLHAGGYPCPEPLDGPVVVDDRVVTIQTLLTRGTAGEARDPAIRAAMTASLAEHIELLQSVPGGLSALAARLGPGPAWTRHADGPWPEPHDAAYDFSVTPPGGEWLDEFAQTAATDLRRLRGVSRPVVAHADWYAGNLRFHADRVVAAFDWELFAEQEAVVAGLSAGGYLTDDAPAPDEVAAYLDDYADAAPLASSARDVAWAAARWMLSFNARCDLAVLVDEPAPRSVLDRLIRHRNDYRD